LVSIVYFYLSKDISTDLSKNREISRIYKNAISLGDKSTSDLLINLREDGKITLSEYNVIVDSYKSYLNSPSLDQSISKAEQREREFMRRKYLNQENAASFALAN
jgi:hypothetical protein